MVKRRNHAPAFNAKVALAVSVEGIRGKLSGGVRGGTPLLFQRPDVLNKE